MVESVKKLKAEPGPMMVLMGSGSIISPLTQAGLIDEFQCVVIPVILGSGRSMFQTCQGRLPLKLLSSRAFANGNLFVCYEPKT